MDAPLSVIQAVYLVAGSLVVFLLGIIAVGSWRRG